MENIKWERCEFDPAKIGYHRSKADIVWVYSSGSTTNKLNRVAIASNLCKQLGLKACDSIWLYKSGDTFMIRKEKSDFVLRYSSGSKVTDSDNAALSLTSIEFVAKIMSAQVAYDKKSTVFDAWVVDDGIVFKARQ